MNIQIISQQFQKKKFDISEPYILNFAIYNFCNFANISALYTQKKLHQYMKQAYELTHILH